MKLRSSLISCALTASISVTSAFGLQLSSMFSDNMVLQRDMPVQIWGLASAGERITAELCGNRAQTKADKNGRWRVSLPAQKAGGPHLLSVRGRSGKLLFQNVLIGEVWLCSGQSNMTFNLKDALNGAAETAAASFERIRLYSVPRRVSASPQEQCGGSWQACSPAIAGSFSAVAYFFGKELHEALGVPIGLIHSSWPGTACEAWTPWSTLAGDTVLQPIIYRYEKQVAQYPSAMQRYRERLAAYEADSTHKRAFQLDRGNEGFASGYAAPDFSDSSWKAVTLPATVEAIEGQPVDGAFWFRKRVTIPQSWRRKELTLHLGTIDDFDAAYCNGTLVGQTGAEVPESYLLPRNYAIPAALTASKELVISVRVFDHFGGGGFMGPPEALALSCSARNQRLPLLGQWRCAVETALNPGDIAGPGQPGFPRPPADPNSSSRPAGLYNGMLHCVAPYSLRGAIWYQGESNADRAQQYQTLLPAMISSWRHAWNDQGLYFGIVQLANFMKHDSLPVASEWAELREAQLMTAQSDSHAGLAVTIDIGDAQDIHPKNKLGVGRRLSQWALARVYSRNSQPHSGPLFRSVEFLGNSARVVFGHAGRGLVCAGSDTLHGFCIAGSDSIFHWASAAITDDSTITVRSDRVRQPIALRYAWGNNPRGNLYNSDSLPASPFRTDKWPGLGWTKR